MNFRRFSTVFLLSALAALAAAPDFERDVQPILKQHCVMCHQGAKPAANLKLDSMENLLKGSSNGAVVVAGSSGKSSLVQRLSADRATRMPPTGESLPAEKIRVLADWVDSLAVELSKNAGASQFSEVQAIFQAHCYQCHAGSRPQAQLRLDAKAGALKGGLSGPIIQAGSADKSRLMHRVLGLHGERQMPLGGNPLTEKQTTVLKDWINAGAVWPDDAKDVTLQKHWSYVKPAKPTMAKVSQPAWVKNPIDAFILARLDREKLTPSAEASKVQLIRRLSLDLIGLPPSLKEVEEFVKDQSADAYEKQVDRLLASPHYGEKWARWWLDLARYADTHGFEKDDRRVAWMYRDWVIHALNKNQRFDEFSIEQIAGDMLPNATNEQRIATGFHRNTQFNEEGGVDPAEAHWDILVDRASTTSTVWLGSTMACAQCHNHKFDPFTQKEFYQMIAFFNNSKYEAVTNGDTSIKWIESKLELPTAEQDAKRRTINDELAKLKTKLATHTPTLESEMQQWMQFQAGTPSLFETLSPTKVTATGGSELLPQPDGGIFASGANPQSESYLLEFKTAKSAMSAIRLEALPDARLPRGGPGRDVYGNATITDLVLEIAPTQNPTQWQKVEKFELKTDAGSVRKPNKDNPALWFIDASREEVRLARQLLLIPAKPLGFPGGTLLRLSLGFHADVQKQGLGKLRVSVTTVLTPERTVEVRHSLRPLLSNSAKWTPTDRKRLEEFFRTVAPSLKVDRLRSEELRKQLNDLGMATALVMAEASPYEKPMADIRLRGSFLSKGERVFASTPAVFHPFPEDYLPNRLGLARWLMSKENPITARVTVNRIWDSYFGRGLVETSEDFGSQGSKPSHPELLDWLATEFVDSGWDLKKLHQTIVLSATYRQSSAVTPMLQERDPDNRWLARAPRYRLDAEGIRDTALSISGLLSSKVGGPSVFPYQPDGVWDVPYSSLSWQTSKGEDRYRRGVYTFIRRTSPYPTMANFDGPSREICTVRRTRTNTPLQALNLLNDPAFFEAAQAFARRIEKEVPGSSTQNKVQHAFLLATQRMPTTAELKSLTEWFATERAAFQQKPAEAIRVTGTKQADAELAALTLLANSLLNLDEVITRD
jgi:mono/diheme cytochrome c family protein